MNYRTILAVGWLAVWLGSFTAGAATYFVATNGNDSAQGTVDGPWLTLKQAVAKAQPGDVVRVGPGHYDEVVNVVARHGETNQPIVFDGQGQASVRAVSIRRNFITWQGFRCGTKHYEAYKPILGCSGSWCLISSNIVRANLPNMIGLAVDGGRPGSPFNQSPPQGTVVRGNIIENVSRVQAVGLNGIGLLFEGNLVRDCPDVEAAFYLWGISNILRGNIITNMNDSGKGGTHPDVFQTFADNGLAAQGYLIERNLIINCNCQLGSLQRRHKEKFLDESRDWTFRNNLFVNVASKIDVDLLNVKFHHNTFYNCMTNSPEGFIVNFNASRFGHAHGGEMINNAFLLVGKDPSKPNQGWFAVDPGLTNMVARNNYVGGTDWSPKSGLRSPNWISGGDPKLTRAARRRTGEIPDLHPLPGSPLLGAGLSLPSVTEDFDGKPRPKDRPAIGALE